MKLAATDLEFSFNFPSAFTRGLGEVGEERQESLLGSFIPLVSFRLSFSSFVSLEESVKNVDLGEDEAGGITCLFALVRHFLKIFGAENL